MRKILFVVLLALVCTAASTATAQSIIDQIAGSHVEANVPRESDFDAFMKRDLEVYFKGVTGKAVEVKYELLRNGPTQTGIAYPKFYLWVEAYEKNSRLREGAVRVAAIEKKNFSVTNFLERTEIGQNPEILYSVVPRSVADKIKEKIAKK